MPICPFVEPKLAEFDVVVDVPEVHSDLQQFSTALRLLFMNLI